eukprot:5413520-Amphidinium_carterae.1
MPDKAQNAGSANLFHFWVKVIHPTTCAASLTSLANMLTWSCQSTDTLPSKRVLVLRLDLRVCEPPFDLPIELTSINPSTTDAAAAPRPASVQEIRRIHERPYKCALFLCFVMSGLT